MPASSTGSLKLDVLAKSRGEDVLVLPKSTLIKDDVDLHIHGLQASNMSRMEISNVSEMSCN